MTDDTQPEAREFTMSQYASKDDMIGAMHTRIAELESELEAVGAGGVQALSAAPAVPAGWKAVPVNPTPEMWKAAKSVPDPNPPYPPHCGLVWDAMLAASPTPPAEQQAVSSAVLKAIREANMQLVRTGDDAFMLVPYKVATTEAATPKAGATAEAALGGVYAELPKPSLPRGGFPDLFTEWQMRYFADRTYALRMQAAPKAAPGEPEDSDGFGSAEHWKEKAQYWAGVAHRLRGEALRGEPVDGIVHPPAPQQEAQEPVAWLNPWRADQVTTDYDAYGERGIPLYTAPQPSPTAQATESVQEDAARLDFLIEQRAYVVSDPDACPGHWLRWARPDGSTWVQVDEHPTPRAAIDAGRKQGSRWQSAGRALTLHI